MTDNDVIKEEEYVINSLKFLIRGDSILGKRIFNLINRQMAEIEYWKERYERTMDNLKAVLEERGDEDRRL